MAPFNKPISGLVTPRFGGIATFMRMPHVDLDHAEGIDIGLVGIPWDGGTTNRPGPRHGPRQMRDMSSMVRPMHQTSHVVPSKLANMLASGRPVVATADRGTSLAEEVDGCGLVVPPGEVGSFTLAIEALADAPARRAELGNAARRRATERWSKAALVHRFIGSLEQALAERRT